MHDLPDFSEHGYRVENELSQNRAGGRVTYLATDLTINQKVVIKQFQFAKTGASWTDYDSYEREIETLRGLNHPGIPCYLNSFQNLDGFCMVQEYKPALSLSSPRSFSPTDIRQIAIATLDILIYLQGRIPPVIHRDVKPENILVDEQMNVYLVDFGFARVGHGEVGVSSVVKGTLGFMPPEQLFNRQLTEASDLYSLGITLICLLTNTKSSDIGNLIDISYRVNFKHLTNKISPRWIRWLEKMVEPRVQDRYANAAEALAALPDELILPEAIFSQANLTFVATRQSQKLTQTITLHNHVPQTLLEGKWEVAPHPNDPPHTPDRHLWIAIHPQTFQSNEVECQITVDTSKLMSNKTYQRQLLLHTNATSKTYSLTLQVQTAPIPINAPTTPYGTLSLLGVFSTAAAWFTGWVALATSAILGATTATAFCALAGSPVGLLLASWLLSSGGSMIGAKASMAAGVLLGLIAIFISWMITGLETGVGLWFAAAIGLLGGAVMGVGLGMGVESMFKQRFQASFAVSISLLTTAFGTSLGLGLIAGFINPLILLTAVCSGLPLLGMLLQLPLQRVKFVTEYRRAEQHLIKP